MLAQEPDSVCGEYDPAQTFNGIMDEIRIWSTVRTPQQILDNYKRPIDPLSDGLALYWNFDRDIPSVLPSSYNNNMDLNAPSTLNEIVSYTVDQSGHVATPSTVKANGVFGVMPTFDPTMTWNNGRASGLPTRPRYVISQAPLIGGGQPIIIAVAANERVNISLLAFDDLTTSLITSIATLPSIGSGLLYQNDGITSITSIGSNVIDVTPQTKQVIFAASSTFNGTSFMYTVNDGIGHIVNATVILILSSLPPPLSQSYTTIEDVGILLLLGGVSPQGNQVQVVIKSLPLRGTLYQVTFNCANTLPNYACIETNTTKLVNITTTDTIVTIDRGIVYYVPNKGGSQANGSYDQFLFSHRDNALTSASSLLVLYVTPVNHAPVCLSHTTDVSPLEGMSFHPLYILTVSPLLTLSQYRWHH
jgi:hypothetical protein